MEIIRRKAKVDGIDVPEEITHYIAEEIESSPRDLEAAFMRVVVYSSVVNEEFSVELAAKALSTPQQMTVTNEDSTHRLVIDRHGSIYRTHKPRISIPHNEEVQSQKANKAHLLENYEQDGNHETDETSTFQHFEKRSNILLGIVNGVGLSLVASVCMLFVAFTIDFVLHQMGLVRPDIPLLWGSTVALNILTVLIPFDFYRFVKKKSSGPPLLSARLWSFCIVESMLLITMFLQFEKMGLELLKQLRFVN